MLEARPDLRPVAVSRICRHPELGLGVRRTLERRIRRWLALHGPKREVIFRQTHEPGRTPRRTGDGEEAIAPVTSSGGFMARGGSSTRCHRA